MKEYFARGWRIAYDETTGNVTWIEKDGMVPVGQTATMFSLAIDGRSIHNDQRQMHNIEMYDVVGKDSRLLSAEETADSLALDIDLGEGFGVACTWTPKEDWVSLSVTIRYDGETPHRLRWLNWRTECATPELLGRVEPFAPGYTMNLSEPFDLRRPIGEYRHGELLARGLFGDHVPAYRPGFLGYYDPQEKCTVCTWHVSEVFPFYTEGWTHDEHLNRGGRVHCARWMRKGDRQTLGDFFVGAVRGNRAECLDRFVKSYEPYGWDRKDDYKQRRTLRICELFVGDKSARVLFENYDQVRERLEEIHALGFNAIEIMPKMPFPSYSVFDLADMDITYGSEEGVRKVVEEAHRLGMKVIADMVFHGPREDLDPTLGLPRSPYLDEHEDWFMRHESGFYARTYTRSFDMGHPDYQRHIGDCMLSYIERMGVDGFRLDAQMWSETPNWDDSCPRQPYESVLAGMRMMDDISERIHEQYPEAIFYTEANGPYSAKGHEYRYNYDMHWMFPALAPIVDRRGGPAATQNLVSQNTLCWADAARWLNELRQTSPKGMAIVFQTDSHDSAEWGGFSGGQYSYEAYGPDMHRVLYGMVNFMDGALMSLYGSHKGNDEYYKKIAALLRDEVMVNGECDYLSVRADDKKCITIAWSDAKTLRLYVGNAEDKAKTVNISLPEGVCVASVKEHIADKPVGPVDGMLTLELEPCAVRVFDFELK